MLELKDLVPKLASFFGVIRKRGFLPPQFTLNCCGHEYFFAEPREGCFETQIPVAEGCAFGRESDVFLYLCRGTVEFFWGHFPSCF